MTTPDNFASYEKSATLDDTTESVNQNITLPFPVLLLLVCLATMGIGLAFGVAIWG